MGTLRSAPPVWTLMEDEADRDRAAQFGREAVDEPHRFRVEVMKMPDAPRTQVDRDEIVHGTPTQVADEIIRQCRALGVGNFLASFNNVEPEALRGTHELFVREVVPRLREAEVDRPWR
ncbi:hypothetical protein [Streptomyces sp. ATCC 21386]|uniref:hypothetical protein n=1 Tax=Streptomyces sp. ATCC 21386 TaxID=2699428 RepID=UPI001BFF20AF|nr:hypothetical protein [Streptomyces sp. ATCC 21386]